MMKAIGAWLCRHGFHDMRPHHQSGAYNYSACSRCPKRMVFKVFGGYSPIDDYWLAGNDGEPPAPTPPITGSGVRTPRAPRNRKKSQP